MSTSPAVDRVSAGDRSVGGARTRALAARGAALFAARRDAVIWFLPAVYALWVGQRRKTAEPLGPDANGYFELSAGFDAGTWFHGVREPLWPAMNAIPMLVFGENPDILRYMGLLTFAGLVLAAQYLTREMLGRWVAVAVGFVLASSDWLAAQSTLGLREVLAALMALVVCLAAIRLRPGWQGPLLLGLLVGAAALIRWDTLIMTLPVVALTFYLRRVGWRQVAAATGVLVVLVVPFCIGNAVVYGDPVYHSNIHAVFFRNIEFVGQSGYPTKQDLVERGSYTGGSETWPHYIFARHSLGWVADHTTRGSARTILQNGSLLLFNGTAESPAVQTPTLTLLGSNATLLPWLLALLSLAGALVLLVRGAWPVSVMFVLAVLQHAPIAHLMDPRLGLTAAPFMVIAVAACVVALWSRLLGAVAATVGDRAAKRHSGLV